MKRSRIPRRSKRTAEKANVSAEMYEDAHGVRFPPISTEKRLVVRPIVRTLYMLQHSGKPCALCGREPWHPGWSHDNQIELHHIIGGDSKSDEFCNFIRLCSSCHREVQSQRGEYKMVFRAKWEVDRENTDWRRLLELLGSQPFDSLD